VSAALPVAREPRKYQVAEDDKAELADADFLRCTLRGGCSEPRSVSFPFGEIADAIAA
jgi:hypothetical protein